MRAFFVVIRLSTYFVKKRAKKRLSDDLSFAVLSSRASPGPQGASNIRLASRKGGYWLVGWQQWAKFIAVFQHLNTVSLRFHGLRP
jgi:hypothetical protein